MSTGARLPFKKAEQVARALVAELAPACERIEIAGSLRRRRPDIGDIELVAVPRMVDGQRVDLFAPLPKVSALDEVLAGLERAGRVVDHPTKPRANGDRYKRRWLPKAGLQVDLFIVLKPAEWGPIFTIRTGSATYSEYLVTKLRRKGWRCEDGRVLDHEERLVSCPEEEDFFGACDVAWVPPEERSRG